MEFVISRSIALSLGGTLVAERRHPTASGLVSIFRFGHRMPNLSEPYSESFEQLRKAGLIHKYVMAI